ncbi:MAG: Serine/threonine-protein kinase StkP [Chlamydiae bacterium]|nr:Serine/threonine-protein kinase StkP [Chlamydiota bacterium]
MTTVSFVSTIHIPILPETPPFEILEEIGEGETAKVYKAKNAHGQIVALKCFFTKEEWMQRVLQATLDDPNFQIFLNYQFKENGLVQEAISEFEIAKKLDHPHIVKILDSFVDKNGVHTLVLEFVDGKKMEGFSSIDPKLKLQLLDTLIYIHDQGFVHEDLYSDNFMTEEGNLKMIDLGSLTPIEDAPITLKEYAKHIAVFANIDKSYFSEMPKDEVTEENLKGLQKILCQLREQFKTEFQQAAYKTRCDL